MCKNAPAFRAGARSLSLPAVFMKVTLNWLKQYVDFNWSPEELTERLTMLGLEVEGVQKIASAFDGIVVAQVITRDKHPNADKLSICRVNDGTGERQIVCGAKITKWATRCRSRCPARSCPAISKSRSASCAAWKARE